MSTQGLATLERLALDTSKCVEDGGDHEKDGSDDQARCLRPDADPLYNAQYGVESSAHVVRLDLADKAIEFGGRGADTEEQRDFNKDNEERGHSASTVNTTEDAGAQWKTYKQTMLNAMTNVAWKMFAIPSAKQRMIHSTPVLFAS